MIISILFGPSLWAASLLLIVYAYFGYPLLLFLMTLGRSPKCLTKPLEMWPRVSLIISAYNEAGIIEEKIKNTLALNYPPGKLEVWVASDGSTDQTNQVVSRYHGQGVRLFWQEKRQGKSAVLNQVVPLTSGQIVVLTDANAFLDRDSLQSLVLRFQDERIGFVTGRTEYVRSSGGSVVETTGLYNRYERYLKRKESILNSCVGADGAVFAIRKNLYSSLRPGDLNDLAIPLNIVRQGYRGIMEESALAREDASGLIEGEVHRQIRITNRTLRTLFRNRALLNPFHHPFFAWQLFSHKLLRLTVPFLMITLLAANLVALGYGRFYIFFLYLQIAFYALVLLGFWLEKKNKSYSLGTVPYHFLLVNWAMLRGWFRCLSRNRDVLWTPERG